MNRIPKIVASFCLLSLAQLAAAHPTSIGYAYDAEGKVVRTGSGGCLRTAEWTPANAIEECDAVAKPAAPAPVAAQPQPAPAVTPAPAPKTAVATLPPTIIKIDLRADDSFASGKAELSADAKSRLDDLTKQLNGAEYDKITVTGHADRIGKPKANQKLSERRAKAAADYLVAQGIPADKISSNGKGSSEPVTQPGDCAKKKGKALSACLAPDRRVEVRVSGTRTK